MHAHRVTEIAINKTLPHFGDVVVVRQALKKPHPFENRGVNGVCLGHDNCIAGGVLVVSVVNGALKEVCFAKVRGLGKKVGQAWRFHVHPQDSSRAAYVNSSGDVKWGPKEFADTSEAPQDKPLRGFLETNPLVVAPTNGFSSI